MVPLTRPLATGSRFNSGSPIPHHPVKRPNKVTVVEVEDEGEIERRGEEETGRGVFMSLRLFYFLNAKRYATT